MKEPSTWTARINVSTSHKLHVHVNDFDLGGQQVCSLGATNSWLERHARYLVPAAHSQHPMLQQLRQNHTLALRGLVRTMTRILGGSDMLIASPIAPSVMTACIQTVMSIRTDLRHNVLIERILGETSKRLREARRAGGTGANHHASHAIHGPRTLNRHTETRKSSDTNTDMYCYMVRNRCVRQSAASGNANRSNNVSTGAPDA